MPNITEERQPLRTRIESIWARYSMWPLLFLSVVFIIAYAVPIVAPTVSPTLQSACETTLIFIWITFIVDYVGRLFLSQNRILFLRTNVIDLLAIMLPALRPLRALRIVSVILIATRRLGNSVRHRVTIYLSSLAFFTWFMAGLAMTDAEYGVPDANIKNFVDGLFWSFTALIAGGNGPLNPVSDQGKIVEVVVFLASFALVGTLSAIIVSWIIDTSKAENTETKTEVGQLRDDVAEISAKMDALLTELRKTNP